MTCRRTYRRGRAHRVAGVVVIVLVLLIVVRVAAHAAGVLVLVAVTGVGCYRWGLARRPVTAARITTADPETAMLRQQAAQLQHDLDQARAELADARASATAAWDQASSRPPRRALGDTQPLDVLDAERLASTPMSGARTLFGGQP